MKKLLYILILIFSLFMINNLVRSIFNLWQKHDLITQAKTQLQKQQDEQSKLQDQLSRVKRQDFVEEEARNKLFMVKPGEKMVLIGHEKTEEDSTGQKKIAKDTPNWKQWVETFF